MSDWARRFMSTLEGVAGAEDTTEPRRSSAGLRHGAGLLFMAAFMILAGSTIGIGNWQGARTDQDIREHLAAVGRTTTAVVTKVTSRSRGDLSLFVEVRLPGQFGTTEVDVSSSRYLGVEKGARLPVVFDPADPTVNMAGDVATGDNHDYVAGEGVGIGLVSAGLLLGLGTVIAWKRITRA